MQQPGVRAATPGDVDAIARVHVDAWRETYSGVLPESMLGDEMIDRRRAMWARVLGEAGPVTVFVAESDGRIVGFASCGPATGPDALKGYPAARPLHLYTIYLLAAEHGSGLAQQLLEALLGDRPAQLWVLRGNARAIAFYERNGFRADGVEVQDGDLVDVVDVRMVR